MDRPPSATSSAPIHKRTKSATSRLPSGPILSSLYLTNLRLLNLDRLADWPAITPFTFSNIDARARIKAAEWSLYQLFRLFDPALTAERLQPFFPPLEPLQSINLRAALYRCLDGLKKNGVLGREAVLRKTMLDECAGDKFWEVCVSFSAVVVRKKVVAKKDRDGFGRPAAQTLGIAQGLGKADREAILPLMVAHRVSLSRTLSEKQKLGEEFAQLEGVLHEKEHDLGNRTADLQRNGRNDQVQKQLDHFRPLEDVLRKGWVGDEDFEEAVLSGGSAATGDRVLVQPTEHLFDRNRDLNASYSGQEDIGLVENIASKARGQNLRLKRWQALYDRLQAAKPKLSATDEARASSNSTTTRFDRHADLTLADTKPQRGYNSPTKSSHVRAASAFVTGYDNILSAMREDLRLTHHSRRNADQESQDVRHNRSASDAVTGAGRNSAYYASQSRPHSRSPSLQYSPSQQAPPIRPGMGRRVSSRSRSYQQPKVISQRGPIPLKTELFSPLKSARPGTASPNSASMSRPSSLLPSPQEEKDEYAASIDGALNGFTRLHIGQNGDSARSTPVLPSPQEEEADESVASIDSAISEARNGLANRGSGFHGTPDVDSAMSFALPKESASPVNLDPPKQDPLQDTSEFKQPSLPPVRPSLAERTRLTMTFTSSENTRGLISGPHSPTESPSPTINTDHFPVPPSNTTSPAPYSPPPTRTLADRTRQSISSSQPPVITPSRRPSQHARSRTSVQQHPNATPRERRSSHGNLTPSREQDDDEDASQLTATAGKRIFTPREQLFETGVEYDSVFKSRPKVAHSPLMSPSVVEHDEEEFSMVGALRDLDDDEMLGSSPLRR